MPTILSLQGGMAAGKTTAARYVEQARRDIHVSYEDPGPVLEEVRKHGYRQDTLEGFVEIQRLFIVAEIARWRENQKYDVVLMDMGPEEIAFFTLHYPKSRGFAWDVQCLLRDELEALRGCRADRVLFVDVETDRLRRYKEEDRTRRRGSFEHYVERMLPMKKDWFFEAGRFPLDVLDAGGLDRAGLGEAVLQWVARYV